MDPETRRELWAIVQAICALYCCFIGTWALVRPPVVSLPVQGAVPGVAPVSSAPHMVWWFWILIGGFVVCAATLAAGTIANAVSRLRAAKVPVSGTGKVTPHQQLINEKTQLDNRIIGLSRYIKGDAYPTLAVEHQRLLDRQLKHMAEYSKALGERVAVAEAPAVTTDAYVIVSKIEHPDHGMTPETSITMKNVGKEIVQNVTLKSFFLSGGKEVSFTSVATLGTGEEKSISPRIKGMPREKYFQHRDLLDAMFSEWANTAAEQKEFSVKAAIRFENLKGDAFEVPFDLVYFAHIHRLCKISNNERTKRESVLLEARNFKPVRLLSSV